jgi:hypothetical protein
MAPNTSPTRRVSRIFRGGARPPEDDVVPGTAAERMQMMWQPTLDAWAFRGEPIEPRLQRHTVRIVRRRRLNGLAVPVIGRDDLLRNKAASGRPKDLADLAALGEDQSAKKPSRGKPGRGQRRR